MQSPHDAEAADFRSVGIVGLGLIGGSIGLAVRALGVEVVGADLDSRTAEEALHLGAISRVGSLAEAASCDLFIAAVPPAYIASVLAKAAPDLGLDTVVTDVGGVKGALVDAYRNLPIPSRAVPSHPMAGREVGGIASANGDLFRGARWVVCPIPESSDATLEKLERFVRSLGAEPIRMSAEVHDREIAVMSHLPHALAAGLMDLAAKLEHPRASAGSWKDVTRVAGVDPELWTQIFTMNRQSLAHALSVLDHRLTVLRHALVANDAEAVQRFLQEAKDVKETYHA